MEEQRGVVLAEGMEGEGVKVGEGVTALEASEVVGSVGASEAKEVVKTTSRAVETVMVAVEGVVGGADEGGEEADEGEVVGALAKEVANARHNI